MDVKTPEARTRNMAAIKNSNTKPEIMLRKALFRSGLRYRIKSNLPGKPDIVFPGSKVAIFVDGCFWHGCPLCYQAPENNWLFWHEKLIANKKRDSQVNRELADLGWKVLRFWEHEIMNNTDPLVERVRTYLIKSTK